jgi:hypothetical protein
LSGQASGRASDCDIAPIARGKGHPRCDDDGPTRLPYAGRGHDASNARSTSSLATSAVVLRTIAASLLFVARDRESLEADHAKARKVIHERRSDTPCIDNRTVVTALCDVLVGLDRVADGGTVSERHAGMWPEMPPAQGDRVLGNAAWARREVAVG